MQFPDLGARDGRELRGAEQGSGVLEQIDAIVDERARLQLRRALLVEIAVGELAKRRRLAPPGQLLGRILAEADAGENVSGGTPSLLRCQGCSEPKVMRRLATPR